MGLIHRFTRARRLNRAQGMTEYVIIVGLIGVLLIGVVSKFGETLDVTIQGSADLTNSTVTNPIKEAAAASEDDASSSAAALSNPTRAGTSGGTTLYTDGAGGSQYYELVGGQYRTTTKTPD